MKRYLMGRKMSRAAKFYCIDDKNGEWYFILEGSANDILKGIKEAELKGYTPLHSTPTTLRNGRRYKLCMDYYDRFWSVTRVA